MPHHWMDYNMRRWQGYGRFLRKIHLKPFYFGVPVALSLVAAGFEAVVLAVLIPLLEGVVRRDYSFVTDVPVLSWITSRFDVLQQNRAMFVFLIVIVSIGTLVKVVTRYLSGVSSAYIAKLAYDHMRRLVFRRYLSFGKQFFDVNNIGYLNAVLMSHSRAATKPIEQFQNLLNALFSLIIYVGMMFYISWQLALFVLLAFPVMNWLMQYVVRLIKKRSIKLSDAINSLGRRTHNILTGIPLVMLYSRQTEEERIFAEISERAADTEFRIISYQQLLKPAQELVMLVTIVALIVIMAMMSARGENVTPAAFIVFFYLVVNATSAFTMLHRFRTTMAEAEGPTREFRKVMQDEGKYFVADGREEFAGLEKSIRFNKVSFTYDQDRKVLRDVSFEVNKGEMTALVGPTGSGKSTIINLILRYYDCKPGDILVDERDIRDFTLSSWRAKAALVSQDPWLFHDTLRHNITYGLSGVSEGDLLKAIEGARLSDLVARLSGGLETEVGDRGVMLSGGEKQRVAIARALLKQADLLILDEATSALDSKTEKLVQAAINEAIRGRTSIVIAHRLATIKQADKILVLENGQLIEWGSLDELLTRRAVFYKMWEAQKFN